MGATGRVACELCLHLRKRGYPVTVMTTGPEAKTDEAKNLTVIRLKTAAPKGIWSYQKIQKAMVKAALKLPPHDIVISMTDPPLLAMAGATIAKKMRAKHIHWAMDLYPDLLPVMGKSIPSVIYKFIKIRMIRAIKKADAIVPISQCMRRYMTHQGLPRQAMRVIENWPEIYLKEKEDAPAPPLFSDEKFRILYAGTIGLAHDFDAVIQTAAYLRTKNPEIEFVFTDRGRGAAALKERVKRHRLSNVRFIKPLPNKKLSMLTESGDIHLITMKKASAGKLFPSKFYTACATGRPILFVGPKECDIHNKIEHFQCGRSVRNHDHKTLIRCILYYRNHAKAWFEAGENAKKAVANPPSLKQWEDLITELS